MTQKIDSDHVPQPWLTSAAPELLEALKNLVGTVDDPNNGWRGPGGTEALFSCEYCHATNEDCTQIRHTDTCPIPAAHAAIAKATGATT